MFFRYLLGLISFLGLFDNALAAPSNDAFSLATAVTGRQVRLAGETTLGATTEPNERLHGRTEPGNSVWYRYTAPISGYLRVNIVDNIRIHAALYSGSTWDTLRSIAQTSGDAAGDIETLTGRTPMSAGEVAYLAVDSGVEGEFDVGFELDAVANDFFSQATVLAQSEGTIVAQTYENNEHASLETGEPVHGTPSGNSLWYQWTPETSGPIIFDTRGSAFDTVLAIYTGNAITGLHLVGANDDTDGMASRVQVQALAGTTYHIVVAGAVRGDQVQHGDFYLHYYRHDGAGGPVLDMSTPLVVSEGAGSLEVRVIRVRGSSGDGAFSYSARGQVAIEGKDFTPVTGQGNLSGGASLSFNVPILEDLDIEGEEYFSVSIDSWDPAIPSTGSWAWIVDNDQAPNDDFANLTLIAGSFGSMPITNHGGSIEPGEPTAIGDGESIDRSHWYKWIAPADGIIEWRGEQPKTSGDFSALVVRLFAGSSVDQLLPAAHSHLELVPEWPQGGLTQYTSFRAHVTDGTEYFVQCASYLPGDHAGTMSWKYIPPSVFAFENAEITSTESGQSVVVTIGRTDLLQYSASVWIRTRAGTAQAPGDFEGSEGTLLHFPAMATTASFSIAIHDDQQDEEDETFAVELFNPSAFATLGPEPVKTVTILDDDVAGVFGFEEASVTAPEDSGSVIVTIHRTNGSDGVESVNFATEGATAIPGVDFQPTSGVLTFLHGETEKTIEIPLLNDLGFEYGEEFRIVLSEPTGRAQLGNAAMTIAIADDDLFSPRKGNYSAALHPLENDGRAGLLTFDTLTTGKVTGKLRLGGTTFRIRTALDQAGWSEVEISGKDGTTYLLGIQFLEGSEHFQMTLTDTATELSWMADGQRSSQADDPAHGLRAGKYTVYLDPGNSPVQGFGTGALTIRKNGRITLVGALADKTAFSASGMIDVAGEVPIFVPLYKKRGHLAGKVELRERSESLGGADTADAVGQFNWYKPAPPEDSSSLSGIDQALDFRAAYYTAPSKGERALSSFDPDGTGRLQLEGGNLESLERALTWSSSNQIAVGPGEGQVTIAVNAKTGFFKGKWKRDGTRAIPLRGVLFQKSGGIGIGSFIHGLESGSVLMTGDGPQTD